MSTTSPAKCNPVAAAQPTEASTVGRSATQLAPKAWTVDRIVHGNGMSQKVSPLVFHLGASILRLIWTTALSQVLVGHFIGDPRKAHAEALQTLPSHSLSPPSWQQWHFVQSLRSMLAAKKGQNELAGWSTFIDEDHFGPQWLSSFHPPRRPCFPPPPPPPHHHHHHLDLLFAFNMHHSSSPSSWTPEFLRSHGKKIATNWSSPGLLKVASIFSRLLLLLPSYA